MKKAIFTDHHLVELRTELEKIKQLVEDDSA